MVTIPLIIITKSSNNLFDKMTKKILKELMLIDPFIIEYYLAH